MQSSFSGILATINRSSNHLIFGVASNTILRRTPREFETGDRLAVRSTWMGRASDLLRIRIAASEEMPHRTGGWPRNPRALAGRLHATDATDTTDEFRGGSRGLYQAAPGTATALSTAIGASGMKARAPFIACRRMSALGKSRSRAITGRGPLCPGGFNRSAQHLLILRGEGGVPW